MSLITPEELLDRLDDPSLRIADVRWSLADPLKGRRDYAAGHIPGAVFVDLDADLAAGDGPGRHPLPDPAAFAGRMAALGFGDEHEIVAYDDAGGTVAARLWWMLDDLGHPRARVLDGGLPVWAAAGGPLIADVPRRPAATLRLRKTWRHRIERPELLDRLGRVPLLDARAPERYRGEVEPVDAIPGHIPTARSAPTAGNLGEDGRFLPPDALQARFEALAPEALTPGEAGGPVIVACGSGVNAAHLALAMRVAGLPDPLLYGGSYSDWSRAGLPVAAGEAPGTMPPTAERD